MKRKEIEILLEKYFEAETTIQEEKVLKEYFQGGAIDPELEIYKMFFETLTTENDKVNITEFEQSVLNRITKNEQQSKNSSWNIWFKFSGIAASILIAIVGITYYQKQQSAFKDTFSNPDEALAYAHETLVFVSEKYNKGIDHLQPVFFLNQALQPLESSLKVLQKGMETINTN